ATPRIPPLLLIPSIDRGRSPSTGYRVTVSRLCHRRRPAHYHRAMSTVSQIAIEARRAGVDLAEASAQVKNAALHAMADGLLADVAGILRANAEDVREA